jgi:hypothetical protein
MRLLTILFFVFVSFTLVQGQNNKPCYDKAYGVADTLPSLVSSPEMILEIIKKEVSLPDSLQDRTGQIFISYVINCNGDVVKLRLIQTADSDGKLFVNHFEFLAPKIIKILRQELKWTPAWQGGEPADFRQIFNIHFDKRSIGIRVTAT